MPRAYSVNERLFKQRSFKQHSLKQHGADLFISNSRRYNAYDEGFISVFLPQIYTFCNFLKAALGIPFGKSTVE